MQTIYMGQTNLSGFHSHMSSRNLHLTNDHIINYALPMPDKAQTNPKCGSTIYCHLACCAQCLPTVDHHVVAHNL